MGSASGSTPTWSATTYASYRRIGVRLACGWFVLLLALLIAAPARAADVPMLLASGPGVAQDAKIVAKALRAKPSVARQRSVLVATEYLDPNTGSAFEQIGVELFDGQVLVLQREQVDTRGPGNYTWHGFVPGNPESQAVLTVVDGHIAGSIEVFDPAAGTTQSFRIESGPQGQGALMQLDHEAFPPDHPNIPEKLLRKGRTDAKTSLQSQQKALVAAADSGSTIDVMVVYSNQTAAAAGTAIGAQIQQAVDVANTIYANSGIVTRLRLVHYEAANYAESGDFYTDLNRLTGTSDGFMDGVHALRNTYGADLVSLFVENGSYCGLGWVGPSASYAFTVVNRGCASGNYSFAHELGHNMGALHDPYVDPSTSPYAYGHGFVNITAHWRTVMAYNDACAAAGTSCTRIPYFSNALATYGGAPLGTTSTSDNVRVINGSAYTVANFRAATDGTTCSYSLSPTSTSVSAGSSSGSIGVSTGSGCAVSATPNASWLAVASTAGLTGSTSVSFNAQANPGPARSGTISVNGQSFTVNQASGCTYALSASSANIAAGGGTGSVGLTTGAGCTWGATSSASWLTVTTTSGSGNATIAYSVAANTGALRTANLTVAGLTFTVTEAAASTTTTALGKATLSATSLSFGRQKVGTTSAAKSVTLKNTGAAALTISGLTAGGKNPGDFGRSGTCGVNLTLNVGASCTFQYVFTPTSTGNRSSSLSVSTSGGNVTLQLSGSGR